MKKTIYLLLFIFLCVIVTGCNSKTYSFLDMTGFEIDDIKRVSYNYFPQQSARFQFQGDYIKFLDVDYKFKGKNDNKFEELNENYNFIFVVDFADSSETIYFYVYSNKIYFIDNNAGLYESVDSISLLNLTIEAEGKLGIEEIWPDDPLQIVRNDDGKIVFSAIALTGDSCDIKYTDLNKNKTIDVKSKNEILDYLIEILYGRESVYDYTNSYLDCSIKITYDMPTSLIVLPNTYEFKFSSENGPMTILKNGDLIGTVILSIDEVNVLLDYVK